MKSENTLLFRASIVAIAGNFLLALVKIFGGLLYGSLAVLSDGIDSSADILSSAITLYVSYIIIRPPNKQYPYGYQKADAIASKIVAFIIVFAGAQLFYSTIIRLFDDSEFFMPDMFAVYVTCFSILGKFLLARYLFFVGKTEKSSMIVANAKNMQADIVISLAVLFGLFATFGLKLPFLDIIVALGVSIWIIWIGISIFKETLVELMDGNTDPSMYEKVFNAVSKVEGAYNPHKTRLRKVGQYVDIDMDIEVDSNKTVEEAHHIAHEVEREIREEIPNIYDIVVHIEPIGSSKAGERFGVSGENGD